MVLTNDLKKEIKRMIVEAHLFVELEEDQINDNDPLHLDSMSLMWLITGLEERFGIEINFREVDLQNFETINAIQDYVSSMINEV